MVPLLSIFGDRVARLAPRLLRRNSSPKTGRIQHLVSGRVQKAVSDIVFAASPPTKGSADPLEPFFASRMQLPHW